MAVAQGVVDHALPSACSSPRRSARTVKPPGASTSSAYPSSSARRPKRPSRVAKISPTSVDLRRTGSRRCPAGDHEEVLGDANEAVRLFSRLNGVLELASRALAAQREFELHLEHGQRRSQLVAGIGDEGTLVRQRGVQTGEHRVEGLAQAPELVARRREGEPAARLGPEIASA